MTNLKRVFIYNLVSRICLLTLLLLQTPQEACARSNMNFPTTDQYVACNLRTTGHMNEACHSCHASLICDMHLFIYMWHAIFVRQMRTCHASFMCDMQQKVTCSRRKECETRAQCCACCSVRAKCCACCSVRDVTCAAVQNQVYNMSVVLVTRSRGKEGETCAQRAVRVAVYAV